MCNHLSELLVYVAKGLFLKYFSEWQESCVSRLARVHIGCCICNPRAACSCCLHDNKTEFQWIEKVKGDSVRGSLSVKGLVRAGRCD